MEREAGLDAHRGALIAATGVALVAMLVLPPLFGFAVDIGSFAALFVAAAIPAAFLPYTRWRRLDALSPILETTSLGLLLTLPIIVLTYAAMRVGMPIADERLMAWDAALGFNWPAFVQAVDRSAALSRALAFGYGSFHWQLLLLPTLLGLAGLPRRSYRLMLGYALVCASSAVLSVSFPARAAYVAHGLDAATLTHIDGHFGRFFLDSFDKARSADFFTLALGDVAGIITFPSVHVGVAVLCGWAAWPSRPLRAVFLPLNVLMAVSAITHGAHYLVDVLAGGGVAVLSIAAVGRIVRALDRPRADASAHVPGRVAAPSPV